MIISTEKNFLFVHIPKTGGSSVEHMLNPFKSFDYDGTHLTSFEIKTTIDKHIYNNLYKFSTVRNPWDLQLSCWTYYVRSSNIDIDFETYIHWKFEDKYDFEDIVNYTENRNYEYLKHPYYVHRVPQIYFLIDEYGKFLVDYVVNLETIESDFEFLNDRLDLDLMYVPKINVSNSDKLDYRGMYTEDMKNLVSKRFDMDIKIFGYEFDSKLPTKKIKDCFGDNINEYGFKIPENILFSISDIPYGFEMLKRHFDNDEDYIKQKEEFDNDRLNKIINLYESNVYHIRENIEELKNKVIENFDSDMVETDINLIKTLTDKELIYLHKLRQMRQMIGE
jgi:hypothetical protein